jgi:peptidoglycan/LPS O-acetylase OafA/YrhL
VNRPLNNKHYIGIDALRFGAAALVVAFHFGFLLGINPISMLGKASRQAVVFSELYDYTHFGWIGVQIFFVISGFVIAFSGEKAAPFQFFQSRVVRLGPAVWICAPLTLITTLGMGFLPAEDTWRGFRHSMAFLPWSPWIDGSYWTLGIEVAFYAMVWLLIRFGRFAYIKPLAIVIGVASSLFWVGVVLAGPVVAAALHPWRWNRPVSLLLIHHGMFFAMGVFLWSELIKKSERINLLWIGLFCIGGCLQIIAENDAVNQRFSLAYQPLLPCAIWLASLVAIAWSVRGNAALHRLPGWLVRVVVTGGAMTYPLYLLHQIIGGALMGWLVVSGVNRWTALVAGIAAILALTWVVAVWLEPALQAAVRGLMSGARQRYLARATPTAG